MNTKELIERLEQIWQDLPIEAMRQSRELDEVIEELKDDARRFCLFRIGDDGVKMYWGKAQWWTANVEWAGKYSRKTAVKLKNILGCLMEEAK